MNLVTAVLSAFAEVNVVTLLSEKAVGFARVATELALAVSATRLAVYGLFRSDDAIRVAFKKARRSRSWNRVGLAGGKQ